VCYSREEVIAPRTFSVDALKLKLGNCFFNINGLPFIAAPRTSPSPFSDAILSRLMQRDDLAAHKRSNPNKLRLSRGWTSASPIEAGFL